MNTKAVLITIAVFAVPTILLVGMALVKNNKRKKGDFEVMNRDNDSHHNQFFL